MPTIDIQNLKKYFGKVKAVDGISLSVEQGEIFGFLGPNGAGKTTTIRCMMDFIRPLSGSIEILGKNAQKDSVELKKQIGYLSGYVSLYDKWTGQDHIDFVSSLNGAKDHSKELTERFDFDPTKKTKGLSSGNKQKLGLIMAFMFQPKILILDEPTIALDPLLQNTVYELLSELTNNGSTVFMSSHNLAEVDRTCSRVGIIKDGKIVAVQSIQALKEMRMYTVTAYFSDHFDKREFDLEGIEIIKELPSGLVLNVRGDLDPLIKKLGQFDIKDLEIEHASLDDIFLEYYKK
ncbi:MAG: ABC transporter [Candidatus Kerfeldbacteria bacterium CG_4_10_14_0_8_um_filter_42_10]|uniref:ABC transporter n=1 Tax=Candidatus Kerfeldbacteria bacterium CG_4_10_14_0_8_um_filter_42_10 TaxID=2014248 RepID=A0A2M7RFH3_9BACT|nr:MAG: ABC transporter [Candidatus Kerfeldbacteria bacterium CG_4_10_14_0_8_um_filter_42_10]